ncbi:MAG: hypothetical protein JNM42_06085 [Propionivibrio sp.]|uniref:hypothetical protein n=1 Tax=Propionivibrio sp. TaxID=2212460 RepID=UPI001A4BC242|nr:hypothetical protein [Propionivibrio sp.]MBL8413986.1 hypothetical protein [Propionivibrio sp.]
MSALAEVITPEEMLIPSLQVLLNQGEWYCRPVVPNEVCHALRSKTDTVFPCALPSLSCRRKS